HPLNPPAPTIAPDIARQHHAYIAQTLNVFTQITIQFFILTANRLERINFRLKHCDRLIEIQVIKTQNKPVLVTLQFHLLRSNQR
ncbi:hypothetical protein LXA62_18230, partial [Erwinia amylovora]|uniref:hypothetical protein n=1 Tax=Erwinia amylovora TaxID=552 RepID=UPI0020C0BD2D